MRNQQQNSAIKLPIVPYAYILAKDLIRGVLNIPSRIVDSLLLLGQSIVLRGSTPDEKKAASIASAVLFMYEDSLLAKERMPEPPLSPENGGESDDHSGSADDVNSPPPPAPAHEIPIKMGEFARSGFGDMYRYSVISPSVLMKPLQWTTSVFVDAFGNGAWEGMLRRTKLLFHPESIDEANPDPSWGLPLLLRELARVQSTTPFERNRSLEIVRSWLERFLRRINDDRHVKEYRALTDSLNDKGFGDLIWNFAQGSAEGFPAEQDFEKLNDLLGIFAAFAEVFATRRGRN